MRHSTDAYDVGGRGVKRRRVGEAEEEQDCTVLFPGHRAQESAGQHGHRYGSITIGDNGRAQIGDTIIHSYHGFQLQADTYETLLRSLTFDRMDARLHNVAATLPTTCEWLIRHEQFAVWTDVSRNHEHHGFLWIKGKPGSGKSTIMKETLAWAERHWSSQIILSYFFNARSPHQLEKSSLGLHRSLLYQLLCALPSSRALFEKRFALKIQDGKVGEWTETELQNFLIELITTLQLPLLNIFIDALDEGSDDDVRRMVRFLECLTRYATVAGRLLRIYLSSRHYPHISIEKSLSLVVEHQAGHKRDIELYIRNELVGGNSHQTGHLRWKILDRSAGVFL
ncbi:hypothetical protein H2198_001549 [Neophaeococcomyces mojaviensis]|uniref:Uncharacterized protein n=1 Tax=Neophaeococcomyces mojaviensis TaxID=3383035 RepID=A0ACC3AGX6_9EURO|nr:hypothetical protein H2198_001549 [Knufia sp. JES_112]